MRYRDLELDAFQEQAITALDRQHSALVSAPTGTGKTIIADWIVERALTTGRRVIYTAPIKALSNQKFRDYVRLHGAQNVGLVTGDLVIRRDAPCLVMTTEILRNMLLGGEPLRDLLAVVLDEIHFLDDRERGTVWEEVLIYLPKHVQIVGLSATLSNLEAFAAWLEAVREQPVEVVLEERRAVPLTHRLFSRETGLVQRDRYEQVWRRRAGKPKARRDDAKGRARGRGRSDRTGHLDVIDAAVEQGLTPSLYFVFSRRDTERCARQLGRHLNGRCLLDREDAVALEARLRDAAVALGPTLDPELRELYRQGIAFHHAGLHVQLKALVEELYEARLIAVLYCTSTFALGLNMPSRSVCFESTKMYDGRRLAPLTTRTFMQMAGRAGRRGLDEVGVVIVRCDFDEYDETRPHLLRYEQGAYEPVRSSFNLSWNSIVNLVDNHTLEQIREIVDKSFLAWHMEHTARALRAQAEQADPSTRRAAKNANSLQRKALQAERRCWDEFEIKLRYLQAIGYLDEDLHFQAGARVLRHLQISEILVTELVLSGLLEPLSMNELFGVCCAITNELGRHVRVLARPTPQDRELIRDIRKTATGPIVRGAVDLTEVEVPVEPDLFLLGRAWAEGKTLLEVMELVQSDTDIAGDLISGFRRAKDLVGQLRDVYADLPDRADELHALQQAVARDEVEVVG